MSKTANETKVSRVTIEGRSSIETQERKAYPFSPISVVLVNDAIQLCIAIVAVCIREPAGLRIMGENRGLIFKMVPLGAIYAIGEVLTLRSISKGSGPVYVVIANMKLVVAAVMSRFFFGRSRAMPCLHWLELVCISLLAAAFTLAEAGSMGAQWHWEGAYAALAKSSLVAFSSVFCEHIYKSNRFMVVLCLQAMWGLVTVVALILLAELGIGASGFLGSVALELEDDVGAFTVFGSGPANPLCDSAAHRECLEALKATATSCICSDRRGWDFHTLLTVIADLSNAISSALVFRRLSAVAKYICRASSAVPMYLFYCAVGRSRWDFRIFGIVVLICTQVGVYVRQRNAADAEAAKASGDAAEWTSNYAKGSEGKDLRLRSGKV
eukprot:TRINITY_DN23080_c0_g1_i1.p1 TRINITY_DN23080_c0_g1~~TRINITY_DN23080_c0_g1_i1.p1  ORF type:complete len:447 (+),score=64.53 TRINITY_DN23080_c0_g1_i1:195-1343(+)